MVNKSIKKFVIITQDYFPDIGGITTWCYEVGSQLQRRNYDVLVVTKSFDGYDGREEQDIPTVRLDHKRWRNKKYGLIYKTIRPLVNKDTVFICANWKMAVPCFKASLFRNIHYFTTVHGMDQGIVWLYFLFFLFPHCLQGVAHIIRSLGFSWYVICSTSYRDRGK